jgi:hypothetical protein
MYVLMTTAKFTVKTLKTPFMPQLMEPEKKSPAMPAMI